MPIRVPFRVVFIALCLGALLMPVAAAQRFSPEAIGMFTGLSQQPNDLARYVYLVKTMPDLPVSDRGLAMQMFASTEDELGLYNEALRDFPLKSHVAADTTLPTAAEWKAADAADVITKLAANRRLVLINEAHHDAHTRQLTLALLPRLRALGFNYFAAEALLDKDDQLKQRGYPVKNSGTEYLREPSYGDIVRLALKLGFKVVSYDVDNGAIQERELGQAENLNRKVFAKDSTARLFVHAGYAHIDKAKGRLGATVPMAMQSAGVDRHHPAVDRPDPVPRADPERTGCLPEPRRDIQANGSTVLLNRTRRSAVERASGTIRSQRDPAALGHGSGRERLCATVDDRA